MMVAATYLLNHDVEWKWPRCLVSQLYTQALFFLLIVVARIGMAELAILVTSPAEKLSVFLSHLI